MEVEEGRKDRNSQARSKKPSEPKQNDMCPREEADSRKQHGQSWKESHEEDVRKPTGMYGKEVHDYPFFDLAGARASFIALSISSLT